MTGKDYRTRVRRVRRGWVGILVAAVVPLAWIELVALTGLPWYVVAALLPDSALLPDWVSVTGLAYGVSAVPLGVGAACAWLAARLLDHRALLPLRWSIAGVVALHVVMPALSLLARQLSLDALELVIGPPNVLFLVGVPYGVLVLGIAYLAVPRAP